MDDLAADVLSANLPYSSTGNQSGVDNPKLLQPFALGWKREVVMRIITDNKKPNCDIYYFDPNGKKLRSTAEVKANLSDGLDLECFSFQKRTLNVEGEMVRQAKIRGRAAAKFRKASSEITKTEKVPRHKTKEIAKSKVSDISKPAVIENSFGSGRPRSKRQSMIRKKQQLKAIMNFKKSKQTKVVPEKKKPKKIDKKGKEVGPGEEASYNNKSKIKRSLKEKKSRKNKQAQRGSEKTKQEKLAEKLCIANEVRDLKSIVQKNIVKYREMREKEMMKKLEENQVEEEKPESSNKSNSRHRSEPISENLEIYLKPLEKGWKRELVYRVNGALPSNQSDIYYYHPNGRKFRSAREVAEHLTPGLTLDCFTFRKEPIGCGEPKEIIRNARASRKSLAATKEQLVLIKGKKN